MDKTTFNKSGDIIIYTLHEDDLYDEGFGLNMLKTAENESAQRVVLDLNHVRVMQSRHFGYLDDIVTLFRLNGRKVVICGLNPEIISSIIHFLNANHLQAYLNIEEALRGI